MRLRDWIELKGWNTSQAARFFGISQPSAHCYCVGKRMPRPATIEIIREKTDGAVCAEDHVEVCNERQK